MHLFGSVLRLLCAHFAHCCHLFIGMVPLWTRLPVNNSISFIYVCLLSFMRGGEDEDVAEESGK